MSDFWIKMLKKVNAKDKFASHLSDRSKLKILQPSCHATIEKRMMSPWLLTLVKQT
jgi:hypothetical protein